MKTKAELVDVRPDVKYQGTIYEYITVLSVGDRTFGAHDGDLHADEFEIGDSCIADLSLITITNLNITDRKMKGIRPNSETPEDYLDHTYMGEIVRIDPKRQSEFDVDVGIGKTGIYLGPPISQETIDSLSVGDYVTFTVSNTQLTDLEPA